MAESQNFKELLLLLNDCQVEYLIVGGYAVMRHSEPRFTKDLDIWVGHSAALRFETTESIKRLSPWSRLFIKSVFHRFAWIF
jgi:hypothetical protein